MCGIAGTIGVSFSDSRIESMLKRLSHRGPDHQAVLKLSNAAFAHARLSIVDLNPRSNQPMECPITGNVLVFNGEIYNYRELKSELRSFYSFRTESDSEVILAGYLKWGDQVISKLRGMFALAFWEKSTRKTLLARDRFGIKPLYFRSAREGFLFASEIKSLLWLPEEPHHINEIKILEFVCSRQEDCDQETLFREVRQVLPGQKMQIDPEGRIISSSYYWDFPSEFGTRPLNRQTQAEFLEILRDTIKHHLIADVPVGSFLSGGLDSSSIAVLASELAKPHSISLFSSVLLNQAQHPENKLIPAVQQLTGGTVFEIMINDLPFLDEIGDVIYHHDEPVGDGSMYAHYALCRLASKNGVKVLLSGSGGDEVFGGYPSHLYSYLGRLFKNGNLKTLFNAVKSFSATRVESSGHLLTRAFQEATPVELRLKHKYHSFSPMVRHIEFGSLYREQIYYYYRHKDPWIANYLNCFKSWTVPPFLHYEDRNSMAFGVETRVPFLDHVLLDYVTGFDPGVFVKNSSKEILRESLRGIVPEPILNQKNKFGFPVPLFGFITGQPRQAQEMYQELAKKVPFFDQKKTQEISTRFWKSPTENGLILFWRNLSLSIWYNQFFLKQGR